MKSSAELLLQGIVQPIHQFTIICMIAFTAPLFAQTGTIEGKVIDRNTGETMPFVNIVVLKGQTQVGGASTDFDGKYVIKPINPGTYTVTASFVGYGEIKKTKVVVTADTIIELNFKMQVGVQLEEVIVIQDRLIDPDKTTSGSTMRREELSRLPVTSALGAVSLTSGVASQDGEVGSFRGSRAGADIYIDGVKIRGNNSPGTEQYDQITENKYFNPQKAPLSTFSIDVDAASYSNIRRFLNNGSLPPPNAVRIEEMINYFNYDYPDPEGEAPFSVNGIGGPCPWNSNNKLVKIGIQGKRIQNDDLPPGNLVFLLDVSGSMASQNKLPLLKESMYLMVEELRKEDKVAIVVYAGSAGLVLPATSCRHKEKIYQAIEKLSAGGSTAGGEGIQLAYEIAEKHFIKNGNNRVILATDGDFNIGISDDDELVELIEEKRKSGIFLTVLGFGMGNLKDSKMEKLADKGNGNYAYIDNLLEAQKVLVKEIGGTLFTIAKDVKIQVEFNPAKVKSYRLIGYENRLLNAEDFQDDKKDAGELGAGHSVTALYEVVPINEQPEKATDSLAYQSFSIKPEAIETSEWLTVKLRYKLPDEDTSKLLSLPISVDKNNTLAEMPDDFKFCAAVAQFGMELRKSGKKDRSTFNEILILAKSSKGDDEEGYRGEFIRLVELADRLSRRFFPRAGR